MQASSIIGPRFQCYHSAVMNSIIIMYIMNICFIKSMGNVALLSSVGNSSKFSIIILDFDTRNRILKVPTNKY